MSDSAAGSSARTSSTSPIFSSFNAALVLNTGSGQDKPKRLIFLFTLGFMGFFLWYAFALVDVV